MTTFKTVEGSCWEMMFERDCPICSNDRARAFEARGPDMSVFTATEIHCPDCGKYRISNDLAEDVNGFSELDRELFSSLGPYIQEQDKLGAPRPMFDTNNWRFFTRSGAK